jgi:hypothetical protein
MLTDPERASLAPRSADAPALIGTLLANPASAQWATRNDVALAASWLATAASELHEPAIQNCLRESARKLTAHWRWPDHPIVDVGLDGSTIAVVDYLPASSSAHWFLRWPGELKVAPAFTVLPIISLATRVPEEVDGDDKVRAAVLDIAIEAVANQLTGRAVRLEARDI